MRLTIEEQECHSAGALLLNAQRSTPDGNGNSRSLCQQPDKRALCGTTVQYPDRGPMVNANTILCVVRAGRCRNTADKKTRIERNC